MPRKKRRFRISVRMLALAATGLAAVWLAASYLIIPRHVWQFEPVLAGPDYDVRLYGALTAAQVRVTGSYPDAVGEALPLLDAYLDGDNLRQPIEITTIRGRTTEASQKVRNAGPVIVEEESGIVSVSVVLPEPYTPDTAPRPRSPWVRIVQLPGRTVAVRPFRGGFSSVSWPRERESFRALLEAEKRLMLSQFRAVRYGPWWAFPPFRRTEIHVTVR